MSTYMIVVLIISGVILVFGTVLGFFNDAPGTGFGVGVSCSIIFLLIFALAVPGIGSSDGDKIKEGTYTLRVGTESDLLDADDITKEECIPGSPKIGVRTGMTNDVSFWYGDAKKPYMKKEVIVCQY